MNVAGKFFILSSLFSVFVLPSTAIPVSNSPVDGAAAESSYPSPSNALPDGNAKAMVQRDYVAASVVPSNAKTVASLQAYGDWNASGDKGAVGHSTGYTKLVSSPTIHGPSRMFFTHYTGSGDERYSINFGADRVSTNFFYDAWVYLTTSASNIANVEMDMNQVIENGQTVIMGVQCDGYSNTWDFTLNLGTAKKKHDHWAHSHQPCNPKAWTKNAWHHVQAYYSHNSSGEVTYHTVWFDGVEHPINATVFSSFALGWGPDLITNFQLDGHGGGSATAYLDNVNISRW
jgi:hypothetical protein